MLLPSIHTFADNLWLWQESFYRKKFVGANVKLVTSRVGSSLDSILCLDSEVNLVQWSENFVNLANLCLVFNEDRSVEVWDLRVDRFANNFAFTCVHETSHSCEFNCIRLASGYEKLLM